MHRENLIKNEKEERSEKSDPASKVNVEGERTRDDGKINEIAASPPVSHSGVGNMLVPS